MPLPEQEVLKLIGFGTRMDRTVEALSELLRSMGYEDVRAQLETAWSRSQEFEHFNF